MTNHQTYVASTVLPVSAEEVFRYHDRQGALERLIPPWESVSIEQTDGNINVGSRVVLKTRLMGIPFRWVAEHTKYNPPNLFADRQLSGPFKSWNHEHHFIGEEDSARCIVRDEVTYEVPFGPLGRFFGNGIARRKLESMFAYRHQVTQDDLLLSKPLATKPINVAVSGASGLVGRQLSNLLRLTGHTVFRLVRGEAKNDSEIAAWAGPEEASKLSSMDAVVHLAGKPIADKRWNESVKREIRTSRIDLTQSLCTALAALDEKPKTLICASATGFYGDRKDEELSENAAAGEGFLPDVCREWEQACQPAIDSGIRVVNARFGMVLSPQGGALKKMLLPAKFAGGALGSGRQWWSWIALDDALGAIYQMIFDSSLHGPVNLVAPEPITNKDFARTLGHVISRPAIFPAPAIGLRAGLGEMADGLLLASSRVIPSKLMNANYNYRFSDLNFALRYLLGRERLESAE